MTNVPSATDRATLVVDDSESDLRLLLARLRRYGSYDVVATARDGNQAVDLAGELQPSVVVMDVMMPGSDGLEALPDVRRAVPGSRIVLTSGVDDEDLRLRALELGADAFVPKGAPDDDWQQALGRPAPVGQDTPAAFTLPGEAIDTLWLSAANAPFGVAICDNYTRIVRANRALSELLGVPAEELVGRSYRLFHLPVEDDPEVPLRDDLLEGRTDSYRVEQTIRRRDGQLRRVVIHAWAAENSTLGLRDEDGRPLLVLRHFEDVSHRWSAEQSLELTEQRFRSAVDSMLDGFAIARAERDETGRIVDFVVDYVNDEGCRLVGLPREQLVGQRASHILPQDRPTVLQELIRVVETGEALTREDVYEVPAPDGHTRLERARDVRAVPQGDGFALAWRDITDRKRADQQLERLSAWRESILEHASVGIWVADRDGRLVEANPAAQEFFGRSDEELRGRSLVADVTPDGSADLSSYQGLMSGRVRGYEVERQYLRPNGTKVWGHVRVAAIPGADGRPEYGVGMVTDITEARRMQAALAESEERFRLTQRHSSVGLALVGLDGSWLDVNPAVCSIVGRTREELLALTFQDITHPDDLEADLSYVQQLLDGEIDAYEMEKRYFHADGHEVTIQLNGSLARDTSGEPLYFIAQIQDITERKRTQGVLDLVFNASPDLLALASYDGYFTRVNPSWNRVLGWSEDELLSIPFIELVHPDDVEPTIAEFGKLTEVLPGQSLHFENRYRAKDGSYRWLQWNSMSLPSLRLVVANARDTTAHKEHEALLERHRADLERSNTELEQFAYVASHDLSEPLRAISGFASLLEAELGDAGKPEVEEYLRFIVDGTVRMQRLITDLLAFSRVGRQLTVDEAVDLDTVVRGVRALLLTEYVDPPAVVEVAPLPQVKGNGTLLHQLFANLISNGLKFHGAGETRTVEVRTVSLADGMVEVSVDDDGIGIAERHRDRVFRMFQRLHTRSEYPGTGMGLAICHKIVQNLGGRIWIEDSPLGGASFHITLPLADGDS